MPNMMPLPEAEKVVTQVATDGTANIGSVALARVLLNHMKEIAHLQDRVMQLEKAARNA